MQLGRATPGGGTPGGDSLERHWSDGGMKVTGPEGQALSSGLCPACLHDTGRVSFQKFNIKDSEGLPVDSPALELGLPLESTTTQW